MKSTFDKEALIRHRLTQARETLRDAHVLQIWNLSERDEQIPATGI